MDEPTVDVIAERLIAMFRPGRVLGGPPDCTVLETRPRGTEIVLLTRWDDDPRLYGIPIDYSDTRHEFYYDDWEASDEDEWLDSVDLGLMIMIDTGFRANARRQQVDDYIELRDRGGWVSDRRFYPQWWSPGGDDADLLARNLRQGGLDPSIALERLAQGRLLAWVASYENNSTGGPWVGQAVVSRDSAGQPALERVETVSGAPDSLWLDLAHDAIHDAARHGEFVGTDLDDPLLEIVGFRQGPDQRRAVDTSFLDEDPDRARAVLEEDLKSGSSWGGNRDRAGRYLPKSRIGRILHRLRWGRSGRKPTVRVIAG